ncbi:hypothetical protein X992_5777 [Burkholderia pseudomallei MSHR5492]|nr:hypothetical protein X992_5777 [Burkholderia pseudomallei MSHR5492]
MKNGLAGLYYFFKRINWERKGRMSRRIAPFGYPGGAFFARYPRAPLLTSRSPTPRRSTPAPRPLPSAAEPMPPARHANAANTRSRSRCSANVSASRSSDASRSAG